METTGEQDLSVSCLPEQIPAEHFGQRPVDQFYAKVADAYWQNEDYVSPEDAIVPVFRSLKPSEVLPLIPTIEEMMGTELCEVHVDTIWSSNPRDLTVDEAGFVHGVLGRFTEVADAVENSETIREQLAEGLTDSLWTAASNWRDFDYAEQHNEALSDEEIRRGQLKRMKDERVRQSRLAALPQQQTDAL